MHFSDDFDSLTDFLVEGDDFAVIAEQGNDEGVDFYVLRCTRAKTFLEHDTVDGFGETYDAPIALLSMDTIFSSYRYVVVPFSFSSTGGRRRPYTTRI